jgi:hypothetical protein
MDSSPLGRQTKSFTGKGAPFALRPVLGLFVVYFLFLLHPVVEASCTVCPDGRPVSDPVKSITLLDPYTSVDTCGFLDALAPVVLQAD